MCNTKANGQLQELSRWASDVIAQRVHGLALVEQAVARDSGLGPYTAGPPQRVEGNEKTAPSRTPAEGHRWVIVLRLV